MVELSVKCVEYKEGWVKDSDTSQCQLCHVSFGIITPRRHHCRICGLCICSSCSNQHNNKVKLTQIKEYEPNSSRICNQCVLTEIRLTKTVLTNIQTALKLNNDSQTPRRQSIKRKVEPELGNLLNDELREKLVQITVSELLKPDAIDKLKTMIIECQKSIPHCIVSA